MNFIFNGRYTTNFAQRSNHNSPRKIKKSNQLTALATINSISERSKYGRFDYRMESVKVFVTVQWNEFIFYFLFPYLSIKKLFRILLLRYSDRIFYFVFCSQICIICNFTPSCCSRRWIDKHEIKMGMKKTGTLLLFKSEDRSLRKCWFEWKVRM